MMIASIALANDCTVVTVNEKHFKDVVTIFNPMRWTEEGPPTPP
jgi:predicted nucleic acid-binding protein